MTGPQRQQVLNQIKHQINICHRCPLNKPPHNPGLSVPGLGSLSPLLMIVGEAPGYHESQIGKPFVGKSGQLLQRLLINAGATLEELWITNVVKHRPPNNNIPTVTESHCCASYLATEIRTLVPKRILAVGKTSAFALASLVGHQLPGFGLRGKTFMYHSTPVDITWHPSYALRTPTAMIQLANDLKTTLTAARQ